MENYNPSEIEPKWQAKWEKSGIYKDYNKSKKFYCLDMWPYPSGDGLHVGHVESYTATDIISRYQRMNGKNVIHPQGWDAFGLPAENYAIKTGVHPAETTKKAIETFKSQMNRMGFSYDWSREQNSSNPEYYKWTQWFFLLLYKNGLAYKKKGKVNWCDSCQTVLANEQAEGGICERCKNEVKQKDLDQWYFKITDFIENNKNTTGLLDGLDKIDWPESIKSAQKNWIGKSEGTIIKFKIQNPNSQMFLEVFTTRVDTIFGCTYCVVAPEHSLIKNQESRIKNYAEVEEYIVAAKNKTDLERMEMKEKTGVEIKGIKAINPFNNEAVPIFVADYVLGHYGTGAVMAVPAHDERDFEFAKKYNLSIQEVIQKSKIKNKNDNAKLENLENAFIEDGFLIKSGSYSGLTSEEAREKMTAWLEKNNLGKKKVNYKLRDWLVSRQRFWGAPIPIIYCEKCGEVSVPEKDLPVMLPMDVDFKPTGESPLALSKTFHNVKCPQCGGAAKRESDTMDTFVCSSWYYFRYADPKNEKEFASKENIKKWLPVDVYVGGAEHAVLHLLYARFFTKVLHRLGIIDFDEPFLKLRNQGMILAEDGRKMSKSLGNVVNPDQVVSEFGADSLRMFEMFMGPLEDAKPWQTNGIIGVNRFLNKVYKLLSEISEQKTINKKLENLLHKTIKKVTEDIENFRFNTAISALMILVNKLEKQPSLEIRNLELVIILLSPFAPHIAEDLWSSFAEATDDKEKKKKYQQSIFLQDWPKYDPALVKDETIRLVVQVNGKVRDTIEASADISEEEAKKLAMQSEKAKKFIEDREIRKVIFVKGRLINIVI